MNRGECAASFPFVGKHEPCRIKAEGIEGDFLRARGTRVAALEQEIKAMADRMGGEVAREAEREEPVAVHEAEDAETDIGPFANGLRRKFPVWSEIEITDKPTGVPGKYNFTEGNSFSEGDRNSAPHEGRIAEAASARQSVALGAPRLALRARQGSYLSLAEEVGLSFPLTSAILTGHSGSDAAVRMVTDHLGISLEPGPDGRPGIAEASHVR